MTTKQLKSDISESHHDIDENDAYFEHLQKLSIQPFKDHTPNGIGEITEINFLNTSTSDSN